MYFRHVLGAAGCILACHRQAVPPTRSTEGQVHIGAGEVVRIRGQIYGCLTQGAISNSLVQRLRAGEIRDGISCDHGQRYPQAVGIQPWQFTTRRGIHTLCLEERLVSNTNVKVLIAGETTDSSICLSPNPVLNRTFNTRLLLSPEIHGIRRAPLPSNWYAHLITLEDMLCMGAAHEGDVMGVSGNIATLCTSQGEVNVSITTPQIHPEYVPFRRSESVCMPECHDARSETVVLLPANHGFGCNVSTDRSRYSEDIRSFGGARIFICETSANRKAHPYDTIQNMGPGDWATCGGVTFACTR